MATALYVSIVTDTGRFTHSNTTSSTLRSAAFLIECGARHTDITRYVYSANSYNLIQLNVQSLATIRLHLGNQVATIWLTRKCWKNKGECDRHARFCRYPQFD